MAEPFADCTHRYPRWRLVDEHGHRAKHGHGGPLFRRWLDAPCKRQRCPCVQCRQSWAHREAAIMQESFKELPSSHFVVLRHKFDSPQHLRKCWKGFTQGLRNLRKKLSEVEYIMYVEATTKSDPHLHVLLRSPNITKDDIKAAWSKACNGDTVVYCEPVRDHDRAARYLPKFWAEREGHKWRLTSPWLPGEEWAGIRLTDRSRGFLSATEDELWQRVKRQWFHEDDTEDAIGKYPVWQGPPETVVSPFSSMPYTVEQFEQDLSKIEQPTRLDESSAPSSRRDQNERPNYHLDRYLNSFDPETMVAPWPHEEVEYPLLC